MDQDTLPFIVIAGSIVWLIILYLIIKGAVRSANSEVERLLRIMINLKSDEMVKNGFTNEEIKSIIDRVKR